jgi:adenylate kinase
MIGTNAAVSHARLTAPSALLLLGPTGAGKTPLGNVLERRGWRGRRCHHFDFGANLRAIAAAGDLPPCIGREDQACVREVLSRGALLEDKTFYIAERIFRSFLRVRHARPGDAVALNGLPRHAGQARDMERLARVELVVVLDCPAQVVVERIRLNRGGDRGGRTDDTLADVERKLRIFRERTAPLIDRYGAAGVRIVRMPVGVATTAEDLAGRLA